MGATLGVLLCSALPAYACCELALGICMSLVGRMSLTGEPWLGTYPRLCWGGNEVWLLRCE